jgi:hypothetical protein
MINQANQASKLSTSTAISTGVSSSSAKATDDSPHVPTLSDVNLHPSSHSTLSAGAIAGVGIAVGVLITVLVVTATLVCSKRKHKKQSEVSAATGHLFLPHTLGAPVEKAVPMPYQPTDINRTSELPENNTDRNFIAELPSAPPFQLQGRYEHRGSSSANEHQAFNSASHAPVQRIADEGSVAEHALSDVSPLTSPGWNSPTLASDEGQSERVSRLGI